MLSKEMNAKTLIADSQLSLGLVDLAERKTEARENIIHSLRLRMDTGEQHKQASSLIGAAGLVLQEGNPQFAAQLLGAVESTRKTLKAIAFSDSKDPFYDQTQAKIKEALGDEAFQSAFEEGSKWSLEETIKKVLGK